MIPKIIHYCWFGGNPLPENARKCIDSWRRFCPDYQIIEWNESNYDVHKNVYTSEAYQAKKWAFATDLTRLDIICEHGGIYMDTDVELLKSPNPLLTLEAFAGLEHDDIVAFGLCFGAVPGQQVLTELRDTIYGGRHFLKPSGDPDLTPMPLLTREYFRTHGIKASGEIQNVNGLTIFPAEYFSPKNYFTDEFHITENTYSIHWYDASWMDEIQKYYHRKEVLFRNRYGYRVGTVLTRLHTIPARISYKLKTLGGTGTLAYLRKRIFGR